VSRSVLVQMPERENRNSLYKKSTGSHTLAGFLLFFTRGLNAGCEDGAFSSYVSLANYFTSLLLRQSLTSSSSLPLLVSTGFRARLFTFEWAGASLETEAILPPGFYKIYS
jgi:hypothetical protein